MKTLALLLVVPLVCGAVLLATFIAVMHREDVYDWSADTPVTSIAEEAERYLEFARRRGAVVEVEHIADGGYIRIRHGDIASTVSADCVLDIDEDGVVIGIELLGAYTGAWRLPR